MTLLLNYMILIDHHATILFNNEVEASFAYHNATQVKSDLIEMFDKDVAQDIYDRFAYLVFEHGYKLGEYQQ
jgi:uncharacterized protein (DUF924 family)